VQDPTEHPKGPQRDPKNNESRRYGGPLLGAPGRAQRTPKGPPGHPWGTEGAAKTAPNKNSEPPYKKHRKTRKGQQKHTPNPTAIYEGLVLMPFGGPLLPFRGPFLEMPRHEENTKTIILLQFWTPRGAKTLENHVFYEGS
jgi:hypothetical protein